jgi:hypothetical protein
MIRSLSIALLFALPLAAQEAATAPATVTPPPRSKPPAVTVNVSFEGGTLGDFVGMLRKSEPKANIVVSPQATEATLPPLELKGAGIEQALEVACSVAEGKWMVHVKEFRGPGEPVFSLVATARPQSATPLPTESHTQVFSLVMLTADADQGIGTKVETVLSAINAATESRLATMRFHQESGLLIVRGEAGPLNLVRDVLKELEGDVKRRRADAQPKQPKPPGQSAGNKPAAESPK